MRATGVHPVVNCHRCNRTIDLPQGARVGHQFRCRGCGYRMQLSDSGKPVRWEESKRRPHRGGKRGGHRRSPSGGNRGGSGMDAGSIGTLILGAVVLAAVAYFMLT